MSKVIDAFFDKQEGMIIMSLKDFCYKLLKKWYIILLLVLIFSGAGFVWSKHVYQPVYSSNASILIHPRKHKESSVKADIALIPTYQGLMQDDKIISYTRKSLLKNDSFHGSTKMLNEQIHTLSNGNSLIIKITADSKTSAKASVIMANTMAQEFKKHANGIIKIGKISQVSKAKVSKTSVTPRQTKKFVLLGALIGFIGGLLLVSLFSLKKFTNSNKSN